MSLQQSFVAHVKVARPYAKPAVGKDLSLTPRKAVDYLSFRQLALDSVGQGVGCDCELRLLSVQAAQCIYCPDWRVDWHRF